MDHKRIQSFGPIFGHDSVAIHLQWSSEELFAKFAKLLVLGK